ncbi:MAG: hypothetical protein ABI693_11650 [Bryobacteraceae bacterium]
MRWIETLFGSSPDGGNGVLELMLLMLPVMVAAAAMWWTRRART